MDFDALRRGVLHTEKWLAKASRLLSDLESYDRRETLWGHELTDWETADYQEIQGAMPDILDSCYQAFCIVLEAAEMDQTRHDLITAWSGYASNGIGKTVYHPETDVLGSEPLSYLERLQETLRSLVDDNQITDQRIQVFENILDNLAHLAHKRNLNPQKESDIQDLVDDYLKAAFPDYRKLNVYGSLRNYKPDGWVPSLQVALELKFVRKHEDLGIAVAGVIEDTAGYSSSTEVRQFYSVFYMMQPYATAGQIKAELSRVGASNWKPIVVYPPGGSASPGSKGSRKSRTSNKMSLTPK